MMIRGRPERTLVMAHGLEIERLLAGLYLHSPSRMILLRSHADASAELTQEIDEVVGEFRRLLGSEEGRRTYPFLAPDQIQETRVDFFSVTRAFAEVSAAVAEELDRGHDVCIDVSSGNKIAAIALFLVGQHFNLNTTYSTPRGYRRRQIPAGKASQSEEREEFQAVIAHSVRDYVALPRLPLRIERVDFAALEVIGKSGSQGTSITGLAAETLGRRNHKRPATKGDIVRFSRIADSLAEWGYVRRTRHGREVRIFITDRGREVLPMRTARARA